MSPPTIPPAGTPVAAGDATNRLAPHPVKFITCDMASSAFDIRPPDSSVDSGGSWMSFNENFNQGCKAGALASHYVIVVPAAIDDPFREVCLYYTDDGGKPVWCEKALCDCPDVLDELDAADDGERRNELLLMLGSRYHFLTGTEAQVREYWAELETWVQEVCPDLDRLVTTELRASCVEGARDAVLEAVKTLPFFEIEAEVLVHTTPDAITGLRSLCVDPTAQDQAFSLNIVRLLLHQAGIESGTPPRLLARRGDFNSLQFPPFRALESDPDFHYYVPVRRPAVASVYLAELLVREMRRRKRNIDWPAAAYAIYRGLAEAAEHNQPIPDLQDSLLATLQAVGLDTPGGVAPGLAEKLRQWLYDIAKYYSGFGVDFLAEVTTAVGQHAVPSAASANDDLVKYIHEGYHPRDTVVDGRREFSFHPSPVVEYYRKLKEETGEADPITQDDDANATVRGAMPLGLLAVGTLMSVHLESDAGGALRGVSAICEQYFQKYLFGFAFYRAIPGVKLRQVFLDDDTSRTVEVQDFRTRLKKFLYKYAPADQVSWESALGGYGFRMILRKFQLHVDAGGDWFTMGADPGAASGTLSSRANALAPYVKKGLAPVKDLSGILKDYYTAACQDIVWGMLNDEGLERAPDLFARRVLGYVTGANTYMMWLGDSPAQIPFAVGVVATPVMAGPVQSSVREWAVRVNSGPANEKKLADVLFYEIEQKKAGGGWSLATATPADGEALAKATAEKVNAYKLQVPAYAGALVNVAGLALTLTTFEAQWRSKSTLGRVALVAKATKDVFATTSSLLGALKVTLQARGTSELLNEAASSVRIVDGKLAWYRYADDLGNVAGTLRTFADWIGPAVDLLGAADLYFSPESTLNVAIAIGDDRTVMGQRVEVGLMVGSGLSGFAGVAATAAGIEVAGIAAASITGPIGLTCGLACLLIEGYLAQYRTLYKDLIAKVVSLWRHSHAQGTDGVITSIYRKDFAALRALIPS